MWINFTNILHIAALICVALLIVGMWLPPLILAIAALAVTILGFILIGWTWQLLLPLLISVIFFAFWWAGLESSS